jgi:hypothetical protein
MDYSKKTREEELIAICKDKSIKGYSGKKKDEIIQLLENKPPTEIAPQNAMINVLSPDDKCRFALIRSSTTSSGEWDIEPLSLPIGILDIETNVFLVGL